MCIEHRCEEVFQVLSDFQRSMKEDRSNYYAYLTARRNYHPGNVFGLFHFRFVLFRFRGLASFRFGFVSQTTVGSVSFRFGFVSQSTVSLNLLVKSKVEVDSVVFVSFEVLFSSQE